MYVPEMEKKIEKRFFDSQIIAFQLVVSNSHNLARDTCHPHLMCKQTPLRFHLTLGDTYSKSISLRMIKEHDKSALMEISQAVGTAPHGDCQSLF